MSSFNNFLPVFVLCILSCVCFQDDTLLAAVKQKLEEPHPLLFSKPKYHTRARGKAEKPLESAGKLVYTEKVRENLQLSFYFLCFMFVCPVDVHWFYWRRTSGSRSLE